MFQLRFVREQCVNGFFQGSVYEPEKNLSQKLYLQKNQLFVSGIAETLIIKPKGLH